MQKASSTTSSSSTAKVTLTDVYETLRKLEEVEQFPVQPQLEDHSGRNERTALETREDLGRCSAYLNDLSGESKSPPSTAHEAPSRVDSILSYLDETNRSELPMESVRSQKSSTRESPAPTPVRFTAAPPPVPHPTSTRQQQQKKLAQSVSVSQMRASPVADQQIKPASKVLGRESHSLFELKIFFR